MVKKYIYSLIYSSVILFSGCMTNADNRFITVMKSEKDFLNIQNRSGELTIQYVSRNIRMYIFDGVAHKVRLRDRSAPFQGRSGLYNPATTILGFPRGIRMVVDESRIDYPSIESALAKLYEGSAVYDPVYTNNGLVVRFGRSKYRNQVNVEVVQITIAGKIPDIIPGSRENLISGKLNGHEIPSQPSHYEAKGVQKGGVKND